MPVAISHSVRIRFGASHLIEGHPTCGRMHGHQYTVVMTFGGFPNREAWGSPVTYADAQTVGSIVDEFRDRHINDMLPAGFPSVDGLASYLLERTRMHGVTKVEVHESDTSVTGTAEYIDR